jgi:UDP-N-acetylglucosamine--N-acetylmuramyl-(pentapeptide) pyrophosphoryl-undecaprenol N-acetylglucosamine transferase
LNIFENVSIKWGIHMKIMVSGGGTGGHIYPALALINEIKKNDPNAEFLYVGTDNGLESKIVPKAGIPFRSIKISGFKRKISLDNAKTIMRFFKGVSDSRKFIKEFKPDVVIGTGGYVCGPVVYAASKLKVPAIIHEQNSLPGVTNKFLARYVDKVAICFEEARSYFPAEKTVLTGNPRASEVVTEDVSHYRDPALMADKKTVLIMGGSRGAKPINDAVIGMLDEMKNKDYQVIYVTGEIHYENVMEQVLNLPKNVVIKPFIHNMPEVLKGIDLIVARSGATTLAEITALGLPSILIPSPYVTANHQEKNARALTDHDAAAIILEKDLSSAVLVKEMDAILLDGANLQKMSAASKQLGIPDAAMKLYKEIQDLANQ